MVDKEVDHHVHGHKEPDVDHLEVGGGGECGLDAGHDGGDHQHQRQAHHDPVLADTCRRKVVAVAV